ncbi:MAG: ABC transporter permease [Xanthomonadaceae bacterium]|nr:ABC transporter permease [Xanthomonadaceae bacterium]
MKYFHLIWAALFRRKTRTILTLVSIVAAFLLFGMLDSVRSAFDSSSHELAGTQRLITSSRYSIIQPLPLALREQIARIPGVRAVAYANWFGGQFQDPKNFVFSYAVSPDYLDVYPSIHLAPDRRKAFDDTRTGVVIGPKLAEKYHWKVGDRIPLQSQIFPRKNGDKTWPLDVVGIFDVDRDDANGFDQTLLMHWKYFDEANAFGGHQVGWYVVQLKHAEQADQVSRAIDALSANSDHETKTQTEQAFQASFAKQFGDVGLIVVAIMGAVFFTLILLTGNTMAQAVRERTSELAILKTIGFSSGSVLLMVLAESVLLLLLGGVTGLGLATVIGPALGKGSGGMVPIRGVSALSWATGVGLMVVIGLIVGALPALSGMRLKIVDALARR